MLLFDPSFQQEHWLLLFFVLLVFGLCIGSFLNVVIYRMPVMLFRQWKLDATEYLEQVDEAALRSESKVFNLSVPASTCPSCHSAIRWWQNVPVLSYLFMKGRCANCGVGISVRYPLVELITGAVSVVLFYKFGFSVEFCALLVMTYLSIPLFGIDLDHQLLPDAITYPLLWLGLLVNTQGMFVSLNDAVFGAVFGYMVLWSVYWLFKLVAKKEGMGFGDFKLMAAYGAWFGWQVLPNIVLLSSVVGVVVGVALIVAGKQGREQPLPFGPFIISAAWLTVVFPEYAVLTHYIG